MALGDRGGAGTQGLAHECRVGLLGETDVVEGAAGLAGGEAVLVLLLVVGLQGAADGAQAVHAHELAGLVDDGFVLTACGTARFVAEDLDRVGVATPDARTRRPSSDRSDCRVFRRGFESLRVGHEVPL